MKTPRRPISGVLLFDKSLGLSSNDALQKVKRLFQAEKTGHTGTLDPLASGLLPLMFGEATKFSADLVEAPKTYWARLRLGFQSTTGDAEGELTPCPNLSLPALQALTLAQWQAAARGMEGVYLQTPPMYSALKKDGRALYEYARKGQVVEMEPRAVQLYKLEVTLLTCTVEEGVQLEFVAHCSKGTYIRTLGEDLAKRMGTWGYLTGLRRTQIGALDVAQAHTLQSLQALAEQRVDLATLLQPVDRLLSTLPQVELNTELARRFGHGQRLPLHHTGESAGRVRVYGPAAPLSDSREPAVEPRFLGTGILETDGKNALLRPDRLVQEKS